MIMNTSSSNRIDILFSSCMERCSRISTKCQESCHSVACKVYLCIQASLQVYHVSDSKIAKLSKREASCSRTIVYYNGVFCRINRDLAHKTSKGDVFCCCATAKLKCVSH